MDSPMKSAARVARRTGINVWDAQAAILGATAAPMRAHVCALHGSMICRLEGRKFYEASRMYIAHAQNIREGTAWGIGMVRPLP